MSDFHLIAGIIKILIIFTIQLSSVAVCVYLERRICAFIQSRWGPNRVGPFGLFQPVADMIKLFFKEEVLPANVVKAIFIIAPAMCMAPAFMMMSVIPFGGSLTIGENTTNLVAIDLGMGLLLVLGASSLTVYGLTMGGWSSRCKYSLMGGLRACAQMISYELTLGLAVVSVLLMGGESFSLHKIAEMQGQGFFHWNIFCQPLAFIIFLVALFAETNRLPFDLPEAESELVSGYHTEYSSMKFALFFMGEYAAMFAGAALLVTLFFGGWHFPGVDSLGLEGFSLALLQFVIFLGKTYAVLLFFIQVRWTLPRFRYDQLMNIGWKVLLPLGLLNVMVTGWLVWLGVF